MFLGNVFGRVVRVDIFARIAYKTRGAPPMNNTSVDSYLREGCGRCEHFQTPACKVHLWTPILLGLRELLRKTDLEETMKWGSPCYTLNRKNVVMLASRKDCCALSFFKGAALVDQAGLLESPGPNSRYARLIRFTNQGELKSRRRQVKELVEQAIALERAGTKVVVSQAPEQVPAEFEQRLRAEPSLQKAFMSLTPGRRRSHLIYIRGGKKSETRRRRVEKCIPKIFAGRGFNERV